MARIYVSSTFTDLQECRAQVSVALRQLGHTDVAMEYYVAEDRRPLDRCLADVDTCDLYLGIFAMRYGYVPPSHTASITELEYRRAREMKKECLIFLLNETANWPLDRIEYAAHDRIMALRQELARSHTASFFTNPDNLRAQVSAALAARQASASAHTSPRPRPVPVQAPSLPAHYVERADTVRAVIAELVDERADPPGVLVINALHGLGGVGKTTLAAAVAHDPTVRQRFPDGVFWVALGEQPDLLSHLVSWIQSAGDAGYRPTTIAAATQYLRTLLYSTAALLVVDDVWDPAHARAFVAGGARCRLLITTRRAAVSDELGANVFPLDVMTENEAVALLQRRVEHRGRVVIPSEATEVAALAKEVGYLPLALELMSALVARGYTWARARLEVSLEREFRGYTSDVQSAATAKLEACLQVSLNWLRRESPPAWTHFAWLGVLADETVLTAPVAATLWEVSEQRADDLLHFLADEAILQRRGTDFGVHDLMHDMARRLLTSAEPYGLGIPWPQAHARLLDRYAERTPNRRWDELALDGYIHSRLTWHLQQTGDGDALHALLALTTPRGQNGWYEARQRLGQSAGFLDDVRTAWHLDRAAPDAPLARQVRYALIVASMHSLSQAISPAVVPELVRRGAWTPAQAFDRIRQVQDPDRRAKGLIDLLDTFAELGKPAPGDALHAAVMREGVETAGSRLDGSRKARLLAELSVHAVGENQSRLAAQALANAAGTPNVLVELAEALPPGPWLSTMLTMTTQAEDRKQIEALIEERGTVSGATRAHSAEASGTTPAFALEHFSHALRKSGLFGLERAIELFPHLPEPKDAYAVEMMEVFGWMGTEHLGEMVTRIARFVSDETRRRIAEDLVSRAHGPSVGALSLLASLEEEPRRTALTERALARLTAIYNDAEREAAMIALARTSTVSVIDRALLAFHRIGDVREQAGTIFVLAPALSAGLPPEIAQALMDEDRADEQLATLVRMVSDLSAALKGRNLDHFVQEAAQMVSEWWIVEAMSLTILDLDSAEDLRAVLNSAYHLQTPDLRSRIIGRITLRLARLGFVTDASDAVGLSPLSVERHRILADVAEDLAARGMFEHAAQIAGEIRVPDERDRAHGAISLHLAAAGRLQDARAMAAQLTLERWRTFVGSRLDTVNPATHTPVHSIRQRQGASLEPGAARMTAVRNAVQSLRDQGITGPELDAVITAVAHGDPHTAAVAARVFWRSEIKQGKTWLETTAAQPRPACLNRLRQAVPLMTLVLDEEEVKEVTQAIHEVARWWP